jgi:hypothetical protein
MLCLQWVDGPDADSVHERAGETFAVEARERGISLAEVIRRYVDQGLAAEAPHREALYERATRIVGRYRDRRGARDVGRKHDQYLDEAFE